MFTRVLSTKKKSAHAHGFRSWKFEHVEVNAKKKKKKKKRSRCRLCGEQWWDIPSFILERMGFIPGWEVQEK